MCTAISLNTNNHYFGRNLDLDRSYGEEVCVMPRNFPTLFREMGEMKTHYALIGMATVVSGIPLFYEATNEYGLSLAGLNFPGNAFYPPIETGKDNIAQFELAPWILGQCKTVKEAKPLLKKINIANIAFAPSLPPSPLHWILSDKHESLTIESTKDGLHIYNNPIGALSNNPPFEYQLENLKKYKHLRTDNRNVKQEENSSYTSYCQGLGALGLPGDVSSMSRFVRIAFGKENAVCEGNEPSSVGMFFHLLSSVEMIKGVCVTDENTLDFTGYSSCINTAKGLYYYTTYKNRRISCVDMHKTNLDSNKIFRFPLETEESIFYQNR